MKNLTKYLSEFEKKISSWCERYGIKYEIEDVFTDKIYAKVKVKFTHHLLWLNEYQDFCIFENGEIEIDMGEDNYNTMTEANF